MSQYKFSLPLMKGISAAIAKALFSLVAAVSLSLLTAGQAFAGPRPANIVVDVRTGEVMTSEDPDGLRYPASLTKMMTLYMVFDALQSGRISLQSRVPVSTHASSQAPSKLGVRPGQTFTVEQGILALVTRSANDCATAFAEFLGGSEPRFGKLMTAKARRLGMTRTVYYNANGLPDPRQVTTARDQARLGVALRKHFPQYYSYFSVRGFRYGKQVIGNHNRLLGKVEGVDGIKTGYTRAAGFNLVTSAQLNGRSVVGVVLGGTSGASRDAKMRQLIETYLPQASRKGGGSDAFVASTKPRNRSYETENADNDSDDEQNVQVASVTSDLDLPHKGPVPEARYDADNQLDTRQTNTVPVNRIQTVKVNKDGSLASTETNDTQTTDSAEEEQQSMPSADVAGTEEKAGQSETASDDSDEPAKVEQAAVPVGTSNKVDTVTTASTEGAAKGWVIQVGAAPAKEQAENLLQKAQDKGGKVLRSATPFTVAFNNDGAQLFRARFGGFADQNTAVRACKVLKRNGMSCWASLQ